MEQNTSITQCTDDIINNNNILNFYSTICSRYSFPVPILSAAQLLASSRNNQVSSVHTIDENWWQATLILRTLTIVSPKATLDTPLFVKITTGFSGKCWWRGRGGRGGADMVFKACIAAKIRHKQRKFKDFSNLPPIFPDSLGTTRSQFLIKIAGFSYLSGNVVEFQTYPQTENWKKV